MDHWGTQVATHMVRNHRSLRRRLPELTQLAHDSHTSAPRRVDAARRAADLLDSDVLVQADVEDVLVQQYLEGRATKGAAARLLPQHDTLREAHARLHGYAQDPQESTDVAGLLEAVRLVLRTHLDDEWQVLAHALSRLDGPACSVCEPVAADAPRPSARLYLPVPFETAQRLLTRQPRDLRGRAAAAADATVRRLATHQDVPLRRDLGMDVSLVPMVRSGRVGLYVGQLRSDELETVISPVDFELVLSPHGDDVTMLEVHHLATPGRPLPDDVPAQGLTEAALHAVVGELASMADDRPHVVATGS